MYDDGGLELCEEGQQAGQVGDVRGVVGDARVLHAVGGDAEVEDGDGGGRVALEEQLDDVVANEAAAADDSDVAEVCAGCHGC